MLDIFCKYELLRAHDIRTFDIRELLILLNNAIRYNMIAVLYCTIASQTGHDRTRLYWAHWTALHYPTYPTLHLNIV